MATATTSLLPDHVLAAVLSVAKKRAGVLRFAFRSHDYQLQEIFSDLSGKYPILAGFVFSDSGPEPYSPTLNESVSRLQLSGLIGRENPDYEVVFLHPAAETFYDKVITPKLSEGETSQLQEIAATLLDRVTLVPAT